MYINGIEDNKHGAIAAGINLTYCMETAIIERNDEYILVVFVPATTPTKDVARMRNLAWFEDEDEAFAAYGDMMKALTKDHKVWDIQVFKEKYAKREKIRKD